MIGWLLDHIPTWALVVAGIVILLAAWRLLGLRGLLATLGALVTLGAYRAGRTAGAGDALAKQQKANEKAVQDYERIDAETDRMSDGDLDASNAPWLRKPRR